MSEKPALIAPEQFNEILRVVRETIRAEMRAEFEARAEATARRAEANAWGKNVNQALDDVDRDMGRAVASMLTQRQVAASDAAFNPHGVEV